MLLCLDIGNTQIHGGVFEGDALRCEFRKTTQPAATDDELGIFIRAVLRERGLDPAKVDRVGICTVVPAALASMRGAVQKYFRCEPFVLQAGVRTGLRVRYRNPLEVGADRVAVAIAASQLRPGRAAIVVDCGTATTFDVVTATGEYLGGAILPGLGASADALASHTAKLPRIEIAKPEVSLGRSTIESIQSGLYHGHVGAIRHLVKQLRDEALPGIEPVVFGTGGYARMFDGENLFDDVVPELVLLGLKFAEQLNREPA